MKFISMKYFDYFVLARSVHILAIIIWIGGVAFITTVLLPALKKMADKEQRVALFEQLEHKFALHAKIATVMAGISGYYTRYHSRCMFQSA